MLLLLLLLSGCSTGGEFGSNRPAEADAGAMSRQPAAVSFLALDANPAQHRNQLIRVTGAFTSLPEPPCEPYKGPAIDWALVDRDLRLDVQGYSRVMHLVPEGTSVTVDGFWQLYEGPVGCGKEPPRLTLWYLRAVQLVAPNPLPQLAALPEQPTEPEEAGSPTPTPEESGTPTPEATPSPTATATGATPTPQLTASPAATPEETPTEGAETATATPQGEDTPEVSPTATPTQEGEEGTPPPGETPTPSDYPGPPDPTETPGPYD